MERDVLDSPTATYGELVDRYHEIIELRRRMERRLRELRPGADEGRKLAVALTTVEAEESRRRRLVRDHPDAPPQG